ncbi:MAG: hypothetical protein K0S76_1816 [Herbinix sp.]|jgi:hypothetical protein|nr:hypothetical protein [Herbinix sp.]
MVKKVLFLLLIITLFTVTSCDKKGNDNEIVDTINDEVGPTQAAHNTNDTADIANDDILDNEFNATYRTNKQSYLSEDAIAIKYPEISDYSNTDIQDSVNELIKRAAMQFVMNFGTEEENSYLDISYEVKWQGEKLLSILFTGEEFHEGMPHPNNLFFTTSINMENGKLIKLPDMINTDDDFVNEIVNHSIYVSPHTSNDQEFLDFIYDEQKKTINAKNIDDQSFYFTKDSLGISIEVAYVIGGHAEFEIPYKDIIEFLKQDNEMWSDFADIIIEDNQSNKTNGEIYQALLPEGMQILTKDGIEIIAKGDLNNDKIADVAFVMEAQGNNDPAMSRPFVIGFGKEDGTYDLSVQDDDIILRADEGGVWGDPLDSISINRGSLFMNFYGGSNYRWGYSYQFRYLEKEWILIKAMEENIFTGNYTGTKENYNLLTGISYWTELFEDGTELTTEVNRGIRERIRLVDFDIRSEDKFNLQGIEMLLTALPEGGPYISEALGFSIVIPEHWGGRYAITENQNSLTVYFIPTDTTNYEYGNLFTIIEESTLMYPDTLDYIGEPREFSANGKTFVTGGPTDVAFSDTHPEFVDFINMRGDIPGILASIQPIKQVPSQNEPPAQDEPPGQNNDEEPVPEDDFTLDEIKQFIIEADHKTDELNNDDTMGHTVIGTVDGADVIEYIGEYSTFDQVMLLLGNYYSEEIAERELYRNYFANISGQIGYIAIAGLNSYYVEDMSKIDYVTNQEKKKVVIAEAFDDAENVIMVEYTLEKKNNETWIITEEKGFLDDNHNPEVKCFLMNEFTVTSSSQLEDHKPALAQDGNQISAWAEGAIGDGISEWILFEAEEEQTVTGLALINGYAQSDEMYHANNRIKKIRLEFSNNRSYETVLQDGVISFQEINFNRSVRTRFIKLVILEVYDGAQMDDTYISEVRIY